MAEVEVWWRAYLRDGSEQAFERVVAQTIDLVYSTALRRVNQDAHRAQDVVQAVFIDLARKARRLPPEVRLSGWLHRHTLYVAATLMRGETRRLQRERTAMADYAPTPDEDRLWTALAPLIDEAIDRLEPADRQAICLRFFEEQDLRTVGAALGTSEGGAQKRVSRALDKLRVYLARDGAGLSGAALGGLLASRFVEAAPAGWAATMAGTALQAGAGGAGLLGGMTLSAKWTAGVAVAVGALLWLTASAWPRFPWTAHAAGPPSQRAQGTSTAAAATAGATRRGAGGGAAEGRPAQRGDPNVLRLTVVSGENGQPLPEVQLECTITAGERTTTRPAATSDTGECELEYPAQSLSEFSVRASLEGYASTRLRWRSQQGETIPEAYTLRLARATPIAGRVVDPQGQPVVEADVRLGTRDAATDSDSGPESHVAYPRKTVTDGEGRWRMDGLAADLLPRIYAVAHHPDFVDSDQTSYQRRWLTGMGEVQLGAATVARGRVVDGAGESVPWAEVRVGFAGNTDTRETTAEADGTFEVRGCPFGRRPLTAAAVGYAPTTIEIELTTNTPSFKLVLNPATPLRLQVRDTRGQPVARAWVWLNVFAANAPQVNFMRTTDDQGRLVWEDAPAQELHLEIRGQGLATLTDYRVVPDGREHVIQLLPLLTVQGTVTDAVTGQSVPRVRVVAGYPTPTALGGARIAPLAYWSAHTDASRVNTGGQYRCAFDRPLIGGMPDPGYVLKFEAEGYATQVSRRFSAAEGEVRFDVALRPDPRALGEVRLPNGQPAAGAAIAAITPLTRFRLTAGAWDRSAINPADAVLDADAQGRFRFPPAEDRVERLVAVHPDGYVDLPASAVGADRLIRLQPWGRIEGVWTAAGKPAAGQTVVFHWGTRVDWDVVEARGTRWVTATDAEGRFTLPNLPPGRHALSTSDPERGGSLRLTSVEVHPGETTRVVLGGSGYRLTLRPQWPPTAPGEPPAVRFAELFTARPLPSEALLRDKEALARWRDDAQTRRQGDELREYAGQIQPEGTVRFTDVLPGQYSLRVGVGTLDNLRWGARQNVLIPAEPSEGIIDLGEMPLSRYSLELDAAPELK